MLINKPAGITSHDMINIIRRVTGERRVGHAGTLDPFATGLLIVAVGREATKKLSAFVGLDKTYLASIRLGAESDTLDLTGRIINQELNIKDIPKERVIACLKSFIGRQEQVPPMYSAKKIGGKKLYELARSGIKVERMPAVIEVYELVLLSYKWPRLEIRTRVSSGTYIRALARDIGRSLGCGAYCETLARIRIGPYRLDDTCKLDDDLPGKTRVSAKH